MYYYTKVFGKKLREIRKKMGFTQHQVAARVHVNEDTLRRIENGENVPRVDTLELLSSMYRRDLLRLLTQCRIEDADYFHSFMLRVERKMDEHSYSFLEEIKELNRWIHHSHSPYEKKKLRQLHDLLSALDDDKAEREPDSAIALLVEGIQQTIPDFSMEEYERFNYTSGELRLLMNIAFIENYKKNKEKYLQLLRFCFKQMPSTSEWFPKIAYNLALAYWRHSDYPQATKYLKAALRSTVESRSFQGLPLMYYLKGCIEFSTKNQNYPNSFQTSLLLCDIYKQKELKEKICEDMRRYRHLDPTDFIKS